MADVSANIIIDIDSAAAISNLRRLEIQIDKFQRSIVSANTGLAAQQAAWNASLINGINNTGMFNAKMATVTDSVTRFSDSLEKGKLTLGEYTRYASAGLPGMSRVFRREFDTISQVAESRVKRIQTQYLALGKTVDGVTKAIASTPTALAPGYMTSMAMATQRQQLFNKLIDDGSTKLLNWGKNTQWAGRQLMVGFSIPMAALGAVAAKTFMEIDKATLSLRRVYGDLGTTTEEIDRNVEAIQKLGTEYRKYGISVAQATDVAARAAATGAQNETLMAATEQTLRFATLGQIEYQQALDATISLQTAFGISNDDLAQKIDFLNAVENQTILTINDMSLAIPRVATVIKGLGGSVEDLAIMMTAMREGGVSAENAANALKSGLASLINPTKRATESMASMGINITEIVSKNKGDLMGLIKDFANATNALDEFSRQQVFEQVFGKYQYARMSALFTNITDGAGQAARAMELAGRSAQELAAISEKELSAISETTTVKFQAAVENLKTSIAPLGEAFLKVLTPVANAVSSIANAFNNLPDSVKNVTAVIIGLIAGIGPVVIMTLGLFANALANIAKIVQFFRKRIAGIRGDASAFEYLANSELEAVTATKSLETNAQNLTNKLLIQRSAVQALTLEYEKFAAVAGIAGAAMGGAGKAPAFRPGQVTRLARFADGGTVPGTGNKDTIPALLTPGETVVTKEASQKYRPIIDAMNSGNLPGFNNGTPVNKSELPSSVRKGHTSERVDLTDEELAQLRKLYKNPSRIKSAKGYTNWVLGIPHQANAENFTSRQWMALLSTPDGRNFLFQFLDQEISQRIGSTRNIGQLDKANKRKYDSFKNAYAKSLMEEFSKIKESVPITDDIFFNIDKKAYTKALADAAINKKTKIGQAINNARTQVTTIQLYDSKGEKIGTRTPLSTRHQNVVFKRGESVPAYTYFKPKLPYVPFFNLFKSAGINITKSQAKQILEQKKVKTSEKWQWQDQKYFKMMKPRFRNSGGPIFASNGTTVPGSGNTDTVPAMLTPGEFVVNKQSTAKNLPLLHAINDGTLRGYQGGGDTAERRKREILPTDPQKSHVTPSQYLYGIEALDLLKTRVSQGQQSVQALIDEMDALLASGEDIQNRLQVQTFTNAVIDEPALANTGKMLGQELSNLLSQNVEKVATPLEESIKRAAQASATTMGAEQQEQISKMAKSFVSEMSTQYSVFADEIIDDQKRFIAGQQAFEKIMSSGEFSDEIKAAFRRTFEEQTVAKISRSERIGKGGQPVWETLRSPGGTSTLGRVPLKGAPKEYIRGGVMESLASWTEDQMRAALTEQGDIERQRMAQAEASAQRFRGYGNQPGSYAQSLEDQQRIAAEMERQRIEQEKMVKLVSRIDKEQAKIQKGKKIDDRQAKIARRQAELEVRNQEIEANKEKIFKRALDIKKETNVTSKEALRIAKSEFTQEHNARVANAKQLLLQESLEKRIQRLRSVGFDKAAAATEARRQIRQEDVQQRYLQYRKEGIRVEDAYKKAVTEVDEAEQKARQSRKPVVENVPEQRKMTLGQRMKAMSGRIAGGAAGVGMAMSMASMAPAMMADEQGKFMGMDANAAMMGMMGGGTLLSLLPMFGGAAGPAALIIGALSAAGVGIYKWMDVVDQSSKKAADFGANVGFAANSLNKISELFGQQTPLQKSVEMQLAFTQQEKEQAFGEFQQYFSTEQGQKFIEDLKQLTTAERFRKLGDYISAGIAGGVFDKEKAQLFAKTIASALEDPVIGTALVANIKASTQRTGSRGLLDIAERRRAAVEQNLPSSISIPGRGAAVRTVPVKESNIIDAMGRSQAIGSSIQILQDYGNAVAKANEEMRSGIITFDDYVSILNESKTAQQKYFDILSKALKTDLSTDAVGGQALRDFNAQISAILSPEQMDAMKQATELTFLETGLRGQEALREEAQRKASVAGAITGGMNADQAIATMQFIRDNVESEAAKIYQQYASRQNVLEMAAFAQTSQSLAAELGFNQKQTTQYFNVGIKLMETGAMTLSEYQSLLNTIPQEKRINFVTYLNGVPASQASAIVSTQQTTTMSGADLEKYVQSAAYAGTFVNPEDRRKGAKAGNEEGRKQLEEARKRAEELFGGEKTFDLYMNYSENGKKKNSEEIAQNLNSISYAAEFIDKNIPEDMQIMLGIDTGDPKQMQDLMQYKEMLPGLAAVISTFPEGTQKYLGQIAISISDGKNVPLTPEELIKRGKAINKALKDLGSKNVKVEKEAIITIIQNMENGKGEAITPEQASKWQNEWVKDFGQKNVSLYTETTIQNLVKIETEIQGVEAALAAAKIELLMAERSGNQKAIAQSKLIVEQLQSQYTALQYARTAYGANPPKSAGGGGGGGQENWLQALLRQAKEALKIFNMFEDIVNNRAPAFKKFISGPFAPEFIQFLQEQGIEAVKVLNGSVAKFRQAYDAWIKKNQAETMTKALLFPQEIRVQREAQYAKNVLTPRMGKKGIGADIQSRILEEMGPQAFLAARGLGKPAKKRSTQEQEAIKIFREFTRPATVKELAKLNQQLRETEFQSSKTALQLSQMGVPEGLASAWIEAGYNVKDFEAAVSGTNKQLQTTLNHMLAIEKMNIFAQLTNDLQSANREAENMARVFQLLPNASQNVADTLSKLNLDLLSDQNIRDYAGAIDYLAAKQEKAKSESTQLAEAITAQTDALQQSIEKINRLEIRPFENAIQTIQQYIDGLSDQIENIERNMIRPLQDEIDILQDRIGGVQDQIDELQKLEDETNKAYDKRIDALNKIFTVNQRIANQQKSQLNLAEALSSGDIFAAAQAMQDINQEDAQFAQDQMMQGLETEKQNAVLEIQNQIAEKEKEIEAINSQIEQRQKSIEGYQRSIRDIQDQIYIKQKEIAAIQKQIEEAKRRQLELEEKIYNMQLAQSAIDTYKKYQDAITRGDKFEATAYATSFNTILEILKPGLSTLPAEMQTMIKNLFMNAGPIDVSDIQNKINKASEEALISWNRFMQTVIEQTKATSTQIDQSLKDAAIKFQSSFIASGQTIPLKIAEAIDTILKTPSISKEDAIKKLQEAGATPEQIGAFVTAFTSALSEVSTQTKNTATETGKIGAEANKIATSISRVSTALDNLATKLTGFSTNLLSMLGIGPEQKANPATGANIFNKIVDAVAKVLVLADPNEALTKIFQPLINMFNPENLDTTPIQLVIQQIANTMTAMIEPLQTGFSTFIEQLSGIFTTALTNANGSLLQVINSFMKSAAEKLSGVVIPFNPQSFTIKFPAITYTIKGKEYSVGPLSTSGSMPMVKSGVVTPQTFFTGGPIIGAGSRDSMPIMAAPGEFMMRRAAVDKYGYDMLSSINAGSYSVPRYDIPEVSTPTVTSVQNRTNIMAPVYNTYSVNVPVTQPNATADEIANKVMIRMQNINSSNIRSIRGNN